VHKNSPNAAIVACCGSVTSAVTPATAPASENGVIHFSSPLSASAEKREPSANAADTSSNTHIGNTNSSGKKYDSAGTVNIAAPKAEMPKIT
jgi:hypothetical protein